MYSTAWWFFFSSYKYRVVLQNPRWSKWLFGSSIFKNSLSSHILYSGIFNSLSCILLWVVKFCHLQRHFLSFWIFLLIPLGSCGQKLMNCLLDPSLQKETSCVINCSPITALANSLLLSLKSQDISFYISVILFWCNFRQENFKNCPYF